MKNTWFHCLAVTFALIMAPPAMAQTMKALPAPPVEATPIAPPGPLTPVFLELYAAETCPFCPAAERVLNDVLTSDAVIGFTCTVDYFDSGLPSNMSRPFCKSRQQLYARAMQTGALMTPQLIVNGVDQMAGSGLQAITATIRDAKSSTDLPVPLTITPMAVPGTYTIALSPVVLPEGKNLSLQVVVVTKAPDITLLSSSRQVRDSPPHNLAIAMIDGGLWNGKAANWPVEIKKETGGDRFFAIVQDPDTGRIVAVGQADFKVE